MSHYLEKNNFYQNYQRHLIKATVSTNIGINNHDRLIKTYGENANRIDVLRKLRLQSKFTLYWYITFIVLGLTILVLDPKNWFNIFDLFILMVNIDLVARGKLIGIYIGVIECVFYAYICLQSQLFGEIVKVMCISVPLNIFSIVSWTISMKKQKKEKYSDSQADEDVVIKKLKKKQYAGYIAILGVCSVAAYFFLKYVLGQTAALIFSSIALAITIVGKILTAKRYMESYTLFNIGNIICLLMWAQTIIQSGSFSIGDLSMIVYYLACFTNDIYAYGLWKSMYRKVAVNGGMLFARRKVNINRIIKLRRRYKTLRWNKEIDMERNS